MPRGYLSEVSVSNQLTLLENWEQGGQWWNWSSQVSRAHPCNNDLGSGPLHTIATLLSDNDRHTCNGFFSYKKTIIIFLPHRCLIKSKLRRIGGVGWRTFPQLNNYKIREELNLCPKICRKQCLLGLKIGNVCQLLYFVSNVLPLESDSEWKRVSPFRGTSMEENDYQSSSPEVCFYFHSEWMQTNFDKVLAKLGLT